MSQDSYQDDDIKIVPVEVIDIQTKAEIDMQIATAKRYPRDLKQVVQDAIAIVTMDQEAAESCKYKIRRGGKEITGPTVHMAKIILGQFGNVRASARVISNDGKTITSQGVCHDLQKNVWVGIEVKRRITDKEGRTFSEDMQTVTGNAANSIALRNAVYSVVPKSIIDSVFQAAERKIIGELSDNDKFIARRKAVFDGFRETYGLSEERVLMAVNLKVITALKPEHLVDLISIAQSLKDGDTTVDESFPLTEENKKEALDAKIKAQKEKAQQGKTGEQTTIV